MRYDYLEKLTRQNVNSCCSQTNELVQLSLLLVSQRISIPSTKRSHGKRETKLKFSKSLFSRGFISEMKRKKIEIHCRFHLCAVVFFFLSLEMSQTIRVLMIICLHI